jgi:anti-sigma factor RsiW
MSEADNTNEAADDVSDEVIIAVTDYLDGNLTGAAKADVEAKIASGKPEDRAWKQTHDEMVEAKKAISGIRKQKAPETFVEDVTATIHKRSAGRFFARRTLGDRVPFGVLLIIAAIALGIVGYLMRSSPTGSLKVAKPPAQSAPPADTRIQIRP